MKRIDEIIAKNLILLRKEHGYTQAELAEMVQYSDKTISKWETGEVTPSVETLYRLCEIYDISLNEIVKPINEVENKKIVDVLKRNQTIISLLAILGVWMIAVLIFVYTYIINEIWLWLPFVWAVPFSFIVALVFNSIWGKRRYNYLIISLTLWGFITSTYIQFIEYSIWPIYFIGIPIQIALILWSGLKRNI